MYKWNGTRWNKIYGKANDVAIGSDGTMWHLGSNREAGGHGVWRMKAGSKKWQKIPGSGVRIGCGPEGNAWLVNKQKNIYQYTGKGWKHINGKGTDVAVGADGTTWAIGDNKEGGGFGIYKRQGSGWRKVPGSAVRVSVDPRGNAWVVNSKDRIFSHDGKRWKLEPGRAKDIGVGGQGSVWAIGTNAEAGGFGIYTRAVTISSSWQRINGAASDIAVDGSGLAWVRNADGYIFRHNGKRWTRLPGTAKDVGVSPDGQAWVIGTAKEGGGYGIYRWVGPAGATAARWQKVPGSAVRIAVGPGTGAAWVVNKQQRIFQYVNNSRWKLLPGRAKDIGVGANGQMWVIGTNSEGGGYGIYRWTGKSYNKIPGSAVRISVDKDGNAWAANKAKQIYYYNGTRWLRQPGAAVDIGCGADGTHWAIGGNGKGIYRRSTGGATTSWATQTQAALNWKKGVKWSLSFRSGKELALFGDSTPAWSTGVFRCTNLLVLQDDGDLVASCGNKPTWRMGLGKEGPVQVEKAQQSGTQVIKKSVQQAAP